MGAMTVPHFVKVGDRWVRRNPDGTVDVMPSGWRPGIHPHDVKPQGARGL